MMAWELGLNGSYVRMGNFSPKQRKRGGYKISRKRDGNGELEK